MIDATEFTALQNLVADMFVELTSLKEVVSGDAGHAQRQLLHNNSLQSIYEFPQVAGSPVYFPTAPDVFINNYAVGQRPIIPGSGEKPGLYNTGSARPTVLQILRWDIFSIPEILHGCYLPPPWFC